MSEPYRSPEGIQRTRRLRRRRRAAAPLVASSHAAQGTRYGSSLRGRPGGRLRGITVPCCTISPPQTPHGSARSTAAARHSRRIGHLAHSSLARSRPAGAGENQRSGSCWRQGRSGELPAARSRTAVGRAGPAGTGFVRYMPANVRFASSSRRPTEVQVEVVTGRPTPVVTPTARTGGPRDGPGAVRDAQRVEEVADVPFHGVQHDHQPAADPPDPTDRPTFAGCRRCRRFLPSRR
jgi:hypothetical protein